MASDGDLFWPLAGAALLAWFAYDKWWKEDKPPEAPPAPASIYAPLPQGPLGSGPINSTIEASKWRRYRAWAGAAGSIATRKAVQARDRSHFDVASRFDRFCPWLRRKVSKYIHIPTPFLLALSKIASNLERGINGS